MLKAPSVICMIVGTLCDSIEKSKKCYHHFATVICDKKLTLISITRNLLPSPATARPPAGTPTARQSDFYVLQPKPNKVSDAKRLD